MDYYVEILAEFFETTIESIIQSFFMVYFYTLDLYLYNSL